MATNTYTSDLGAAETKIKSLTKAVSEGYSGLPGITDALRKSLSERERTLPALEGEYENKIKELYTADQRYAERYGTPGGEMYIENPMQRQGIISGQKADVRGELGGILNLIQQRSQTLGNAIEKGMELYKYGLEAQKIELEQAEKEWDRIMKKAEFSRSGSGSGLDDSAYLELLRAMDGEGVTEEMPIYSPVKGVGSKSPGGQWTYTGKGATGWEAAGGGQGKYSSFIKAAEKNPKVAKLLFSNFGDIFPKQKEDSLTQTEEYRRYLLAVIEAIKEGNSKELAIQEMVNRFPDKKMDILMDVESFFAETE